MVDWDAQYAPEIKNARRGSVEWWHEAGHARLRKFTLVRVLDMLVDLFQEYGLICLLILSNLTILIWIGVGWLAFRLVDETWAWYYGLANSSRVEKVDKPKQVKPYSEGN